jgi:PPOX class probable F420-dependent enzyme
MARSCSSDPTTGCRTVADSSEERPTILSAGDRALIEAARTATLATVDPAGRPRLVPICFVIDSAQVLWSPLDEKPKAAGDVRELARVRDILDRPQVAVLVQRWSEDWADLAWLRMGGVAALAEPDAVPPSVVDALRARYPQYERHDLDHRPMLRVAIDRLSRWSAAG